MKANLAVPPNQGIWLGLAPTNNDWTEWGWINGSSSGQSVFQTFPQRCLQYCANFAGNTNQATPYIYTTMDDPYNWRVATASMTMLVILETEYSTFIPKISMTDPYLNTPVLTVSGLPFSSTSVTSSQLLTPTMTSYPCNRVSLPNNSGFTCALPTITITDYLKPFTFELVASSVYYNTTYRFNSPWAMAIKSASPNLTIYGKNFPNTPSPCPFTVGSVQCSDYTFLPSIAGYQSMEIYFPSTAPTLLSPIAFNAYQQKRPAILLGELFFSFYDQPITIDQVRSHSSSNNLLLDTGLVANIESPLVMSFISQQFFGGLPYTVWADINVTSPTSFKYNGNLFTPLNSTIGGNTTSRVYQFDSASKSFMGANPGATAPLVTVFGIAKPVEDLSIPKIRIPVTGLTNYDIPMISNYASFNPSISTNSLVASLVSLSPKKLVVNIPSGGGSNYPHSVTLSDLDTNHVRTFITSVNYLEPIITSAEFVFPVVSIHGTNFADPIYILLIGGLDYCINIRGTDTLLTCDFKDAPGTITGQVMTQDQISNNVTFTTSDYTWVNSISPAYLSLAGGTLTINGVFLGTSADMPEVNLINTNFSVIQCPNVRVVTPNSVITCDVPPMTTGTTFYLSVKHGSFPFIDHDPNYNIRVQLGIMEPYVAMIDQVGMKAIIKGHSFGYYYETWSVTLDRVPVLNLSYVNDTYFTFDLSPTNKAKGVFGITWNGLQLVNSSVSWAPCITSTSYTATFKGGAQVLFIEDATNTDLKATMNGYNVTVTKTAANTISFDLPPLCGYQILTLDNINIPYTGRKRGQGQQFKYPPPQIASLSPTTNQTMVQADGSFLTGVFINGTKLMPKLYNLTLTPVTSHDSDPTYAYFLIDSPTFRSGSASIELCGIVSDPISVLINPIVSTPPRPPTAGGLVTIHGKWLAPVSYNGETILSYFFNNDECTNASVGNNYNTAYCTSPPGTGATTFKISSKGNQLVNLPSFYHEPIIESITSTYFGTPGLVSIIGTNFANVGLAVAVGGSPCANPKAEGDTLITCTYTSDVSTANNTDSLPVNVTVDSLVGSAQRFVYSIDKLVCSQGCVNGQCVRGKCHCDSSYTGSNCTLLLDNKPVEVPVILPETTVMGSNVDHVSFNISVSTLREVDATTTGIIKSYNFKTIGWINNSTNNSQANDHGTTTYRFIGTFPDDANLTITVDLVVFASDQEYNFAGDLIPAKSNSVKYRVQIEGWKFASKNNILQMLFLTQAGEQVTPCRTLSSELGESTSNTKNSLRSLEIFQGTGILNAYFSDRLIVDDRVAYSFVELVKPDDPAAAAAAQSTTENGNNDKVLNVLVSVNIPYFERYGTIDPNYETLVTVDKLPGCSTKNKWLIPVVIVVAIVGLAIIVLSAYIIIKKKKYTIRLKGIELKERLSSKNLGRAASSSSNSPKAYHS
ncbi:hypothetical protein SAMD00019534_043570 [Acytostelium subglobosum LB1]|uniref:hypothetical protein n=1 Tax=Acytostelium subglobosum LB1 TaxID=1410327 RepID=UPI0006449F12|nr:hypothetical protein SAMD00019534_043570 [Acytostelium subglobosum LB1]GAM21182.1 hypothetical protein SAMD00019534_043570 [Acytostelium subglobosum LB1]|eukprot:XP_012756316.1 hypothetical protein SAMD00019534_043570 [Acytostelium subglobosum LB1]